MSDDPELRPIQEADHLPQVGVWQLQVPADGRETITFTVRASDGLHEVAAQTTVQVRCPEGWFFNPQPSGCPLPSLVTTFYEQPFEHGTIVYIPALGVHYALVSGQPARQIASTFLPGMCPRSTSCSTWRHHPGSSRCTRSSSRLAQTVLSQIRHPWHWGMVVLAIKSSFVVEASSHAKRHLGVIGDLAGQNIKPASSDHLAERSALGHTVGGCDQCARRKIEA